MNQIFTIGHSTVTLDIFLIRLLSNQIDTIVDVRSVPYSHFANQFNKEQLALFLKYNNINYISMGSCLGARYEDKDLLFEDGKVNFSKVITTKRFQEGIEAVEEKMEKGCKIALMCSEKNPIECHRFSLISSYLDKRGCVIDHIVGEDVFGHRLLEGKLLEYYKGYHKISMDVDKIVKFRLMQNTLFDIDNIDETKLYIALNRLVGYNPMETKKEVV